MATKGRESSIISLDYLTVSEWEWTTIAPLLFPV